ncbi:MAG: SocA family protein [Alkalinema sp. RU_4_3]|nr:SocA family protein [Alkalinema sp. RU_4_3]
MDINFQFRPEKAVEAAAVLCKLHGKPIKYLGLLKMLYIADRVALDRMEQPITGDHYVSMNYGPVLSSVYDLIKGNPVDEALPLWTKYICRRDLHHVALLADPGNLELCEEEEEILQQVYEEFGKLDPFHVAEWTHGLPEWKDPHGSAIPILVVDVLKNLGKSDEEIEEIRQEVARELYLDRDRDLHAEYCH